MILTLKIIGAALIAFGIYELLKVIIEHVISDNGD